MADCRIERFKAEVRKGLGIQTNADKIRSMSDEELAEFLGEFATRTCHYCLECGISCKDERLKWLKAEAEGE